MLVTVKRAWNLPAADAGGTSDPYAVVSVDEKSHKTAVKPHTLEPVWDQAFEFHHVRGLLHKHPSKEHSKDEAVRKQRIDTSF